jgi:hypothetical protein
VPRRCGRSWLADTAAMMCPVLACLRGSLRSVSADSPVLQLLRVVVCVNVQAGWGVVGWGVRTAARPLCNSAVAAGHKPGQPAHCPFM